MQKGIVRAKSHGCNRCQSVILSVLESSQSYNPVTVHSAEAGQVQNEALRIILGTRKYTPMEAIHYLLDLPSIEIRHKVEQVKACLNAMQNPPPPKKKKKKFPLHDAIKEEKV